MEANRRAQAGRFQSIEVAARPRQQHRAQAGSVLLETVLAMLIMTSAGVALLYLLQKSLLVSFQAREQMTCARMAQTGFARIKNMDFYQLFAADSAQANYGLQAAYPYKGVLEGLMATLQASRFDRFQIQVTFMRRDSSDANGNGLDSDLIAYADADANLIDDYDANIRFNDQNSDGDYYDTYVAGGRTVAEQPDTHIKQVTLSVYRNGRLACGQTDLVSLEQFTGDPNASSESVLSLMVSTPSNNAYLYKMDASSLLLARILPIAKSYPAGIVQLRADSASPISVQGETDPLATVRMYVNNSAELANAAADMAGAFSAFPAPVTAALVEGNNLFTAQATKDTYTSPITARSLLYDFAVPVATGPVPSGTVATRSPYVAVSVGDPGVSTTTTSGVCPDVISMRINGADASFSYDPAAGKVVWIDTATNTVPVLSTGSYTAVVEVGDYAGYKASATWSFTLSIPDTDNSAPSVANKLPIGIAGSQLPVISVRVFDNQSGIVPSSIVLKLDGVVVVSSANIGAHYSPETDTVSYTPSAAFASGSNHNVEITASHWATDPADKITSVDVWSFNVP